MPMCPILVDPQPCGDDAPYTVRIGFEDEESELDVCKTHLRMLMANWRAIVRVGQPVQRRTIADDNSQVSGIESTLQTIPTPAVSVERVVPVEPAKEPPRVVAVESPKPPPKALAAVPPSPRQQETIARASDGLIGKRRQREYRAADSPGPDYVFCNLKNANGHVCGEWIRESKVAEHMRRHKLPAIKARVLPEKKHKCERPDHVSAGCTRSFDDRVALKAHQTATKIPPVETTQKPTISEIPFQRPPEDDARMTAEHPS
jgi:hypothetical protein